MFSDSFAGISPEKVIAFCIAQLIGALLAFLIYKYYFRTN
jgi:glycerol uptake facilitator-like aquaporin